MQNGAEKWHRAARILVVEDDATIGAVVREALEADGHEVTLVQTAERGFFLACSREFELLILDRMLPDRDGVEILGAMREQGLRQPTLMLTALDRLTDRVQGLDAGADDYLTKPFEFPELLARVRALLRRSRYGDSQRVSAGDLVLDRAARTARRGGAALDLTAREFELLEYLVRNKGSVVSRRMLARDVWKEPFRATPLNGVIDVHMARLRRKVEAGFPQKLIQTVRGVGYVIRDDAV
jgi:DNA-binding response OmpR family regulator